MRRLRRPHHYPITMASLQTLASVVKRYTEPGKCALYRNLYGLTENDGALRIETEQAWKSLPLLDKDILLATPFADRTFVPLSECHSISASSGTSGKPVLFSPRADEAWGSAKHRLEHYTPHGAHLFWGGPYIHREEKALLDLGIEETVVAIAPEAVGASLQLAVAVGTENIHMHAFLVPLLLAEPEHLRLPIKFIELAGSKPPHSHVRLLHEAYPGLVLLSMYAIAETGVNPLGVACRPLTPEEPEALFHASDIVHLEIIDPATGMPAELQEGAEGELVITNISDKTLALPLIRYRTGDLVRIESFCNKHGMPTFSIRGRTTTDLLKIPGGFLRSDEVERVLHLHHKEVSDEFEMRVRTTEDAGSAKIRITLYVSERTPLDLDAFARIVERELRVAPGTVYADQVARGLYAPLLCERYVPTPGVKPKRIVRE